MKAKKNLLSIMSVTGLVMGCAPVIQGTVTPMESGNYTAYAQGKTRAAALRIADSDAKVTCMNNGQKGYVVISQENTKDGPEETSTGNAWANAAVKMSKMGLNMRDETNYEVKTVFKCR